MNKQLTIVLLIFFAIQMAHTFFNINNWPFCSYNMFNFRSPRKVQRLQIILYENNGRKHVVVPGNVLEVEFFRANGIFSNIYLNRNDSIKKQFSKLIINRLENNPWRAFDEVFEPVLPSSPSSRFVRMDVVVYTLDFNKYVYKRKALPDEVSLIYSYYNDNKNK